MKATIFTLLTTAAIVSAGLKEKKEISAFTDIQTDSLKTKKSSSRSYSVNKGRHTMVNSDENHREEINFEGEIKISEDFKDIKSISPNGYLKYVQSLNDETRRIEITSDANGNLTRVYKENGKTMPFETAGKQYLAQIMPGMMALTGIGIEDYIKKIYSQSGLEGVLQEAEKLPGRHGKTVFIKQVLKQPGLKPAEIKAALNRIDSFTESDFERRSALTAIAETHFANTELVDTYLSIANKLDSDFESRVALQHLLKATSISKENLNKVIQQVDNIDSDFEKASVLKRLMEREDFLSSHYSNCLSAISKIDSDFEKSRTLNQLVKAHTLSESQYQELFAVVTGIDSDFEKARVLKQIAAVIPADAKEVRENYLKTANTISSDFERKRATEALK